MLRSRHILRWIFHGCTALSALAVLILCAAALYGTNYPWNLQNEIKIGPGGFAADSSRLIVFLGEMPFLNGTIAVPPGDRRCIYQFHISSSLWGYSTEYKKSSSSSTTGSHMAAGIASGLFIADNAPAVFFNSGLITPWFYYRGIGGPGDMNRTVAFLNLTCIPTALILPAIWTTLWFRKWRRTVEKEIEPSAAIN